jgi:hypothetical protein
MVGGYHLDIGTIAENTEIDQRLFGTQVTPTKPPSSR